MNEQKKRDYTDGGRLPTIKEMSGSIHYGGRMVINEDNEPAIEVTTNNPVAQPAGVVEAPQTIWAEREVQPDCFRRCTSSPPEDPSRFIEYRAVLTPDSIAEKARRVAEELFKRGWITRDRSSVDVIIQRVMAIMTTEFGAGGEQDENKS